MIYFLLVPAYIGLLVLALAIALVLRCMPAQRRKSAYIGVSALISIPAVVLMNVLLWVLVMGPVYLANGMDMQQTGKTALGVVALVALTVGPVVVTAIAILLSPLLAWRMMQNDCRQRIKKKPKGEA